VIGVVTRTTRTAGHGHGGNGSVSTMPAPPATNGVGHDYVVPLIHAHVSERVVDLGFWTALAGAAVLGVVDLPVAALIGGTVVIARRHAQR